MLRKTNEFVIMDNGYTYTDNSYRGDADTSYRKRGLHPALISHNISVNIKNGIAYMKIAYELKPEFYINDKTFDINNWIKYNTPEYIKNTSDSEYAYMRIKKDVFNLSNLPKHIRKYLVDMDLNTTAKDYTYANTSHHYIIGNDLYLYCMRYNNIPYIPSLSRIDNDILVKTCMNLHNILGEKKLLNKNNIYFLYYKNIKYKGGKYNMLRINYHTDNSPFILYKYIHEPSGNTNPLISSYQIHINSDRSGVRYITLRFTGRKDLSESDIIKYNNEWIEKFYDTRHDKLMTCLLISKDRILPYSNYVYTSSIMVEGVGNSANSPWTRHFLIYKGNIYIIIDSTLAKNDNMFNFICVGNEIIRGILLQQVCIEKKNIINLNRKIYLLNIN